MQLYLAYSSSLEVMRYLRSTNGGKLAGTLSRAQTLRNEVCTVHQLNEMDDEAQRILSHINGPIHAYISDRNRFTQTKKLVTHLLGTRIQRGSFIDIGHGISLCSPPFLFAQLATKLEPVELLKVGMEMCGYYSCWKLPPTDLESTQEQAAEHPETQGVTFQLAEATSVARISAFLQQAHNLRGARQARAALEMLADRSASPMETATYLLLCLPRRMGGYGLPKPELNLKLTVSLPTGSETRYPDLYWRGRSIDVEYQSDFAHSGEWSRYRDSRRMIELACAEVTVLPLTRQQLMDAGDFDSFAQGLRKLLGIRQRPLKPNWELERDHIRAAVLKAETL